MGHEPGESSIGSELDSYGNGFSGGRSRKPEAPSGEAFPQAFTTEIPRLVASPDGLSRLLEGLVQAGPPDRNSHPDPGIGISCSPFQRAPECLSKAWTEAGNRVPDAAVEEISERVLERLEEKLREDILRNYGFLGGFP
jgi:hypothetical protein